jgi:hypothetical protein
MVRELTAKQKKHPGGRPPKYSAAEELQRKIQHYFDSITITRPVFDTVFDGKDEDGNDIFKQVSRRNNAGEQVYTTIYYENPSVLAMCRHLDIHRDTLCEYEKNPAFSDTIKRAKAKIEEYLEEQLYRREQVTGIIFNLKNNFGWRDKQDIEHSGNISVKLEDFF